MTIFHRKKRISAEGNTLTALERIVKDNNDIVLKVTKENYLNESAAEQIEELLIPLSEYYKKTQIDSKLISYYVKSEIDEKLKNVSPLSHKHLDSDVTVTTENYGANLTQDTFNSYISSDIITIKQALDNLVGFSTQIVTSLPDAGKNGVLYLILDSSASDDNIYNEYIWLGDKFEKIGTTQTKIDLSNYYTKGETKTEMATVYSTLVNIINGKANNNHSHNVATSESDGFLSSSDKIKLDGITGTGDYVLPTATDTVLGGVKVGSGLSINDGVLSSNVAVDGSLSPTSINPVQNKVIQTALDAKADSTHTHDDIYYIKAEIDAKIGDIETALNEILGV